MKQHPAVVFHLEKVAVHDDPIDGFTNIPNHSEIEQYLAQLPEDKKYTMLDYENSKGNFKQYEKELRRWKPVGLDVRFNDEKRGYGGCQMVRRSDGKVGLMVYVNGCSGASAPCYYIVEDNAEAQALNK